VVLLISYDLNHGERPSAYADVEQAIQARAIDYRRPLFSQWLVESNEGVDQWAHWLRSVIDEDDRLLIIQVSSRANGWLDGSLWEWLNAKTFGTPWV
jgi:hypothetical protein